MAPFECDGPLVAGGHQLYRLSGLTLATVFRLPTSGRRQPGYKVDPETGLDVPDDTFDGGRMSRSVSQPSSGTSHALTIAESAREKLAAGPSLAPQGKRVCACAKHSPAGPALPARSERRPCCASTTHSACTFMTTDTELPHDEISAAGRVLSSERSFRVALPHHRSELGNCIRHLLLLPYLALTRTLPPEEFGTTKSCKCSLQ